MGFAFAAVNQKSSMSTGQLALGRMLPAALGAPSRHPRRYGRRRGLQMLEALSRVWVPGTAPATACPWATAKMDLDP